MGLKLLWLGVLMKERGKVWKHAREGKRVSQNLREDLGWTQNKHKKRKIVNGDAIDESPIRGGKLATVRELR
ncbi:hypothetical protein J1N35_037245 [Gossypium stocksii]|uniref:Uncharacterized protein n=1 Tax=Gossypium stocksii TaxID=47602 RepID=A0A9D3UJB0_9ROSI|nr:hypothetical protein J1N35_037245 [Gossypium stocksii]